MTSLADTIRHDRTMKRIFALPLAIRRRFLTFQYAKAADAVNRLANLAVGDICLQVPEFSGEFFMGPRSDLFKRIVFHGEYEVELKNLFVSGIVPDRDVVDVGANLGFFTVAAAKALSRGRVLAAEPGSASFQRLERNIQHNRVAERVVTYKGLVSLEDGNGVINVTPGREEYSSSLAIVHPAAAGTAPVAENVPTRTLDSLVEEHGLSPAMIKIDVEGAEAAVLEGARNTLLKHRPRILCEFSRLLLGPAGDDILRMLADCRYRVIDPHFPQMEPGTRDLGEIWCTPIEQA